MARRKRFTEEQIIEAINQAGGRAKRASKALGCSRQAIYYYAGCSTPAIREALDTKGTEHIIARSRIEEIFRQNPEIKTGELYRLLKEEGFGFSYSAVGRRLWKVRHGLNKMGKVERLQMANIRLRAEIEALKAGRDRN